MQFFRQLSILLDSGIFLDQALELLVHQINNKTLKALIEDCVISLHHGIRLSQAIKDHAYFFDILTVHMIEVGQETGKLPEALEQLCAYQETIVAFRKQLRSASLMPLITFTFFLIIALIIFIVIVPAFASLFTTAGQSLPTSTRMMVAISEGLRHPLVNISIIGCLSVLLVVPRWLKRARWFKKACAFGTAVPFFGTLVRQSQCAYFFHALSLLTKTGVHVVTAFSIVHEHLKNSSICATVERIKNDMDQGVAMNVSMANFSRLFPVPVQALIAVGQESGCLPLMFMQAAQLYKEQVNRKLVLISTFLQPLLMIIIGLMITFLIFAVYLPIFNLSSVIT